MLLPNYIITASGRYLFFLISFLLILPPYTVSQSSGYVFENISIEEGLSQSSVYSIIQDRDGFLWVGTQDGLNKFDGYEFKVYRYDPGDRSSIANSSISCLYQDKKGNIWIGTWGGGLNKYNPNYDSFIYYQNNQNNSKSIAHNRVPVIFQDSKGRLWIGTAGGGLDLFDYSKNEFKHHKSSDGLSHNRIWGITEDKEGNLWIATENGITKFNPDNSSYKVYLNNPASSTSLSHNRVRAIFCDSDGEIWAGTENGLNKYEKKTDSFIKYLYQYKNNTTPGINTINVISEIQDKKILIGTYGGGLIFFDKLSENFNIYKNEPDNLNSISSNDIRSIILDASNIIWIGTRGGGLTKISNSKIKFSGLKADSNNSSNFLSNRVIRAINEDKYGNIWIGTNEGGLSKYNRRENKFYHFTAGKSKLNISNNRVTSIEIDSSGFVWIGTDREINKIDPLTNYVEVFSYQSGKNRIIPNQILSLYDDNKGNLWIGTYGSGLNKFNKNKKEFTSFRFDSGNSISSNEIWDITKDKRGYLWLATSEGLIRFNPDDGSDKIFKRNSSAKYHISSNNTWCTYEHTDGSLWIGTSVGLNKFDPVKETFIHFTEKDGLPNNVILGILPDNSGNLWLSTNKGLCKFNPQKNSFRNFDEGDGLFSNVFYQGAFYRNKKGELFFGSIKGLNFFVPENIVENKHKPKVRITGFALLRNEITAKNDIEIFSSLNKRNITLLHDQNFVTIYFSSLDYTNPAKNKYSYMLKGVDKDWVLAGNKRYAEYTNLNPGEYTFLVRGSNNDDFWDIEGDVLILNIKSPFWSTWWFYSFAILFLFVFSIGTYQYRLQNLKKRQKELLKLIDERKYAEEELRSNRERFELAVNGSNDGIWDWKVGENECYYSARWKELLGYQPDEISSSIEEFLYRVHIDDREKLTQAINSHIEKAEPFDLEFRMQTKSGDYKWFRSRGNSVRDENGRSLRISGSTTDISYRKKNDIINEVLYDISRAINTSEGLEDLYKEIHNNLSKLFNTKNFFVALYDNESDEVTFPYFVDEMDEKFTIIEASNADSLTVQVVQSGRPLYVSEQELIDRRKRGTKQYWGSVSKSWLGVPLTLRDKVIGAIAMQSYTNPNQFSPNDIPVLSIIAEQIAIAIDRKRAENALKESEVRFRALIEYSSDITFILDQSGRTILYSSPSVERILGYQPAELVLIPDMLEVHPEDRGYLINKLKEMIDKPMDPVMFELRLKHKDGSWEYFEATGTNLLCDSAVKGIVINLRDITERKAVEEEIQTLNQDLEKRIDLRTAELTEF